MRKEKGHRVTTWIPMSIYRKLLKSCKHYNTNKCALIREILVAIIKEGRV